MFKNVPHVKKMSQESKWNICWTLTVIWFVIFNFEQASYKTCFSYKNFILRNTGLLLFLTSYKR